MVFLLLLLHVTPLPAVSVVTTDPATSLPKTFQWLPIALEIQTIFALWST